MPDQVNSETRTMLRQYVEGRLSINELSEWLVQAEYDEDIPQDERDMLAGIRLIVIEACDGSRAKDEILGVVSAALAVSEPDGTVTSVRGSSTTKIAASGRRVVTGTSSPVRHAGIST